MIATKLLVNTSITSHIYDFVCGENFRTTINQVIPFLGMYLEKNIIQKRYMHPSVYGNTIYISQDMKAA